MVIESQPIDTHNNMTIDSPARESVQNTEACYAHSFFNNKTFSNSRKALRNGAEKISNTLKIVRESFENLSQRLKLNGRRRHRLPESDTPCCTPSTPISKKKVLGRSPTKLYSPFGIETPHNTEGSMTPYMPETPNHELSSQNDKVRLSWHLLPKKHPRALFR